MVPSFRWDDNEGWDNNGNWDDTQTWQAGTPAMHRNDTQRINREPCRGHRLQPNSFWDVQINCGSVSCRQMRNAKVYGG